MENLEQFYSDPSRAADPHHLPDGIVFQTLDGWFWQSQMPGCLPDGEPWGPFESKDEAIEDSRSGFPQDDVDAVSNKIEALAEVLDADVADICESKWDDCEFDVWSRSYLVCTDDEAKSRARTYILDSAWAFHAEFIAWYCPDGFTPDDIDNIRGDRCEDCNDAILALIKGGTGIDKFVDDAIQSEGLAHFLATYDREELESEDGNFLIYRTN